MFAGQRMGNLHPAPPSRVAFGLREIGRFSFSAGVQPACGRRAADFRPTLGRHWAEIRPTI